MEVRSGSLAGLILVAASSCAVARGSGLPDGGVDAGHDDDASSIVGADGDRDAGKAADARKPKPDSASTADADTVDEDAGAGLDSGAHEGGSTGLDPDVTLPDLNEPICTSPGNTTVCGGVRACRMATPTDGRCDDCNAQGTCSGLVTTACTKSTDCDINLQCFRGKCTLYCTLPQGTECGPPGICIDVGYPSLGLCDPWQL